MKVILNQDVYNLGEEGDVFDVARGYARNYLIPQGLAVLHNRQNVAIFESRKAAIEKRKEEKRQASLSLKEKIEGLEIILKVSSGDKGKLFGSVTNANIAEELKKEGVIVERKKIELPDHNLKELGTYTAKIKLYGNETADLKIVLKSDKETPANTEEKTEVKTEVKAEEVKVSGAEETSLDERVKK